MLFQWKYIEAFILTLVCRARPSPSLCRDPCHRLISPAALGAACPAAVAVLRSPSWEGCAGAASRARWRARGSCSCESLGRPGRAWLTGFSPWRSEPEACLKEMARCCFNGFKVALTCLLNQSFSTTLSTIGTEALLHLGTALVLTFFFFLSKKNPYTKMFL